MLPKTKSILAPAKIDLFSGSSYSQSSVRQIHRPRLPGYQLNNVPVNICSRESFGADDGYCENAPSELTNFSKWCNVEVKNLVDENYRAMERPLCMEEQVAKEVFNVTCSNSIKPAFLMSFTQFQIVSIVTGCVVGVLLVVALWLFIRWCVRRWKKSYDPMHFFNAVAFFLADRLGAIGNWTLKVLFNRCVRGTDSVRSAKALVSLLRIFAYNFQPRASKFLVEVPYWLFQPCLARDFLGILIVVT
ncbi:hypothetical protein ACTXT7_017364 [Hymenolepis weldensis]